MKPVKTMPDIRPMALKGALSAIVICVLLILSSCGDRLVGADPHGAGFVSEAFSIAPDSIILHNGVTLRAAGDTALEVRIEGNTLRSMLVASPQADAPRGSFKLCSGFPIIDLLVELEQTRPAAQRVNWTTPYQIYLDPFDAPASVEVIKSRLRNGYFIPYESRSARWPIFNDAPYWLQAFLEVSKVSSDPSVLTLAGTVAARQGAVAREMFTAPDGTLVCGLPGYLSTDANELPKWLTPSELSSTVCFGVNVAWWCVLNQMEDIAQNMALRNESRHLPEMPLVADTLRNAIFRRFWNPAESRFDAMLYGNALFPANLCAADNYAQNLAIIAGMPLEGMSDMIFAHGMHENSTAIFSPGLPGAMSENSESAAVGIGTLLRAVAASRGASRGVYNTAVGALVANSATDLLAGRIAARIIDRPLSTMVLRGWLGITTRPDGLAFSPSIPAAIADSVLISEFRYRRALLNVKIKGAGRVVKSFAIDGKASEPFFPASFEGEHSVDVILDDDDSSSITCAKSDIDDSTLPSVPEVEWINSQLASFGDNLHIADKKCDRYLFINGLMAEEVSRNHYALYETNNPIVVQFADVLADGCVGETTGPHWYFPSGSCLSIDLTGVARRGTPLIKDKKMSQEYVETNRYRNRNLSIYVMVHRPGLYAIDVEYNNGMGIVNPRRGTALRRLMVDGAPMGMFLFPQLTTFAREVDSEGAWSALRSFSNPLKIKLDTGIHSIALRYVQPNPVFVDPWNNTLLVSTLRLYRLSV